MITKEFSFLSKDGKTNIHAIKWIPDSGEYKAIMQITHGMVEYIERYEDFAAFLTAHGYMVVGHDHLGHGQSIVSENDWGYFAPDDPSGVLVEDMNQLRNIIQKENPEVPYFMFGHSMGSYMLRKYLTKYNDNLRGAIICGTGYKPEKTTRFGLTVLSILTKLRGARYRSRFFQNLTYDKPYRKFDVTGKDPKNSWISSNEAEVRRYFADPKCRFIFTLNGYKGLLEAVQYDCRKANIDKIPDKLPIFLVAGCDDPVGDMGGGVKKVYDMFIESGKGDVTYKIYDGMRHEIVNEIGCEQVREDLLAWMNVRIDT